MPAKKKVYFILTLILLFGAIVRFYRLSEMASFDFDQEYASNFAYAVLREYPIQLIGQGLSVQGLFMGPLYFYFLVPFYAITNLYPLGGFIGSTILGLITIGVYFWVAKQMFGPEAGLIAAFFRATLFSFIGVEWSMTPAFSSDLMVVVTWYLFYRYWHGLTYALIPLGFVFGLYTSFHPILFPFYFVFITILLLKRKLPDVRIIFFSLSAFLIPLLPLMIFEYLHKFLEVKQLLSFLANNFQENKDILKLFTNFVKINFFEPHRIFGIDEIPKVVFSSTLLLSIFFLGLKKIGFWKDNFHKTTLVVTVITFILYYLLYPGHVTEYYFLAIVTLIFLYTCASLSLLSRKALPLLLVIIIVISSFNLQKLISRWNDPNLITLVHKDFIVKEILKRQPKEQEFYVSYIKYPGWNFGFDYLFKLYGHKPQTREAKQPVYTIVIPKGLSEESATIKSGNIGLILPESY